MRNWFLGLLFLTIGMVPFGYRVEELQVTEVRHGLVTMHGIDCVYQIDEDEAWRVGDRAIAVVNSGKIVEVRYAWR